MRKKSNVLKRNSGFLAGCVVAAGVSAFAANTVMTRGLPALTENTEAVQTETQEQTVQEETTAAKVYETDPFTVTASGNILKGVETEAESETETETEQQTDGDGNPVSETPEPDAAGSSSGAGPDVSIGGSGDGSASPDAGSGDGYYYDGPAIEIYDSGNGDYYYTDTSASAGSGSSDASTDFWSDSIFPETYSRYIDESELYGFSSGELRLIRNEIFARHGRIFSSPDLAAYFGQKAWYVPTYSPEEFDANMGSYLTAYELANLEVILKYEDALAGY